MGGSERARWQRYCDHLVADVDLGFALDASRVEFDGVLDRLAPAMAKALEAMTALEAGAIANPDEDRRVGHYWLRAPELAPDQATRAAIASTRSAIVDFAAAIHAGAFAHMLHIGIGGSALGPQFVADALGGAGDRLQPHFIDNTDPDGIERVLGALAGQLERTIVSIVSTIRLHEYFLLSSRMRLLKRSRSAEAKYRRTAAASASASPGGTR